ncbi:MAG: hypothetical protein JWR60_2060 [Polaromonas sp.]|nr:hypothetical protein [Polaromonas sp.]
MKTHQNTTLAAALALAALLAIPTWAQAQAGTKNDKAAAKIKPTVKKAEKPAAVVKPAAKAKPEKPVVSAERTNLKSAAKNVAAGIGAAEAAMTPAELAIAERVEVGKMPCELGASVTLTADTKNPGYFDMQGKNFNYRMFPVATSTGAIRLEDQKAGAVWLQLANKSMLMNQKLGIRLADDCVSPAQMMVAQNMKLNPQDNILEPLKRLPPPSLPSDSNITPAVAK